MAERNLIENSQSPLTMWLKDASVASSLLSKLMQAQDPPAGVEPDFFRLEEHDLWERAVGVAGKMTDGQLQSRIQAIDVNTYIGIPRKTSADIALVGQVLSMHGSVQIKSLGLDAQLAEKYDIEIEKASEILFDIWGANVPEYTEVIQL